MAKGNHVSRLVTEADCKLGTDDGLEEPGKGLPARETQGVLLSVAEVPEVLRGCSRNRETPVRITERQRNAPRYQRTTLTTCRQGPARPAAGHRLEWLANGE